MKRAKFFLNRQIKSSITPIYFSLLLLVGEALSNIHSKAVPGSFNMTIAYQTYMYSHWKNHCM